MANLSDYNSGTWAVWNGGPSCISATISVPWGGWNNQYVGVSNSANVSSWGAANTWRVWTGTYGIQSDLFYGDANLSAGLPRLMSKAELAQQRREQKQREIQYRKEARQRVLQEKKLLLVKQKAEKTAQKLLCEFLDIKQIKELEVTGGFFFEGAGGKWFHIKKGRANNISELEKRNDREFVVKKNICRHISDNVPDYDNMLAQFLSLKEDSNIFIRQSNSSPRNEVIIRR